MSPIQAPWDFTVRALDYRQVIDSLEGGCDVPDGFVCNGNSFVKDRFTALGFDTTAAGIIHDWRFSQGGGWPAFRAANAEYRRNLIALGMPRFWARIRWAGVSAGVLHFNWS